VRGADQRRYGPSEAVEIPGGADYVLGPTLIELGFRAVEQNPVPKVAWPRYGGKLVQNDP
jgi:hypothetical protein